MSDDVKKILLGTAVLILGIFAVVKVAGFFGGEEHVARANMRTLMDAQTKDLFHFELTEDWGPYPHKNPKTGTETLYPIELCFNRTCAKKKEGTPVILNTWLGKPEPTFCPECGSLVRFHNPRTSDAGTEGEPASGGRDR
jgi:hypothetical protein